MNCKHGLKLLSVGLILLSSESHAGKNYVEPDGMPNANLRVVLLAPETYSVHLAAFDSIACKLKGRIGWISGGRKIDQRRIGMPESKPPQEGILERKIMADTPIAVASTFVVPKIPVMQSLMAAVSPAGSSAEDLRNKQSSLCRVPVFTPEKGADYELVIKHMPGTCESTLYRLSVNPSGQVERQEMSGDWLAFPVPNEKPVCKS